MNNSDLIDKYIQRKASKEELSEIKRLLAEDTAFHKEFAFQLELRQAIRKEEKAALKSHLQQLERNNAKHQKDFRKRWTMAAVIALLIGVSVFLLLNRQPNYGELYSEYFEPYPNIVSPIVRAQNPTEDIEKKAFRYYNTRNYAKAIAAFEALYQEEKPAYTNFYYAMSLMAENQIEKAIDVLEDPNWEIPQKLQSQVDWYLALGYLKLENKDKTISYLEKVIQNNQGKAADAQKLLSQLQ